MAQRHPNRGWKLAAAAIAGLASAIVATPAAANSSAAEYFRSRAMNSHVPELLNRSDREYYGALFQAIDREDWARVQAMFADRADGPLHQVARAEYYLAANSPRIELPDIQAWLATALIAATLLAWLRLLVLDGNLAKAEPETLRYRLLHAAARLARSSRRRRLKIAATWPWAPAIVTAWERVTALPHEP